MFSYENSVLYLQNIKAMKEAIKIKGSGSINLFKMFTIITIELKHDLFVMFKFIYLFKLSKMMFCTNLQFIKCYVKFFLLSFARNLFRLLL